ncbi:MAG: multifunctional CCA addition/repair protein [Gammaproteobacteria bacterium]|nr:multifunctional CCA addition/repair protein [Gammaproteobacteria bacterium]
MEIYLVGGAVRDKLLGLEVKDRDWVVVGATPEQMKARGYRQVGKDFPVFLHPDTHEEYALARTERKTGPGYSGFEFDYDATVTLEEDLKRRDLTINAIAEDKKGNLVDPFFGQSDLQAKKLNHVSSAFLEDPVRILRVARFAARFYEFGFSVSAETNSLMHKMVENGEVDSLVKERVWGELDRALGENNPQVFFAVLRECGALIRLFPEIDRLFGVPQTEKYHPEIDTGIHVMMVLQQAARLTQDKRVRFSALTHDLGKGTTPKELWPKHIGHEMRGVGLVNELCDRFAVPNEFRELALLVAEYHTKVFRADELRPDTFIKTFDSLDAFRRPGRFEQFLISVEADSRGRKGFEDVPFPQANIFRSVFHAAMQVDAKQIVEKGFEGKAISDELRKLRVEAVRQVLNR